MKTIALLFLIGTVAAQLNFLQEFSHDKNSCPVFQCSSSSTSGPCLQGEGSLLDGNKVWTVSSCESQNHYCRISGDLQSENASSECTQYPEHRETKSELSYPGEPCSQDSQCLEVEVNDQRIRSCVNRRCKGGDPGDMCSGDKDCGVGLFCNFHHEGTCSYLQEEGQRCETHYDCGTGLYCVKDKLFDSIAFYCREAYSLPLYTNLHTLVPAEKMDLGVLCESGFAFKESCSAEDYAETRQVENGLVKCERGSYCKYEMFYGKQESTHVLKKCVCPTFSSDGQGYCPYALHNSQRAHILNTIKDARLKYRGRGLHTLNKFKYNPDKQEFSERCLMKYLEVHTINFNQCVVDRVSSLKDEDLSKCTAFK